jgi:hypothetical protein
VCTTGQTVTALSTHGEQRLGACDSAADCSCCLVRSFFCSTRKIFARTRGFWILNRFLFTIEINGRGVLTFDASNLEMAEQLASSSQFRAHLMSYEAAAGCRAWDGRQPIRAREAAFAEVETWTAVFRAGGEPERRCLVWLIPVTNRTAHRSPN